MKPSICSFEGNFPHYIQYYILHCIDICIRYTWVIEYTTQTIRIKNYIIFGSQFAYDMTPKIWFKNETFYHFSSCYVDKKPGAFHNPVNFRLKNVLRRNDKMAKMSLF